MAIPLPKHDAAFIERRSIPEPNSGCWLWLGTYDSWGYGIVNIQPPPGRKRARDLAHRVSYKAFKGSIPHGAFIRHHCDNPKCVNPEHLAAGTPKDNVHDMIRRRRHRFGGANPMAKLDERIVAEIKARTARGERPKAIATIYNVSDSTVYQIRKGVGWRHVA